MWLTALAVLGVGADAPMQMVFREGDERVYAVEMTYLPVEEEPEEVTVERWTFSVGAVNTLGQADVTVRRTLEEIRFGGSVVTFSDSDALVLKEMRNRRGQVRGRELAPMVGRELGRIYRLLDVEWPPEALAVGRTWGLETDSDRDGLAQGAFEWEVGVLGEEVVVRGRYTEKEISGTGEMRFGRDGWLRAGQWTLKGAAMPGDREGVARTLVLDLKLVEGQV